MTGMSISREPARQPDVERMLLAGEQFARSLYSEEECFLLDVSELDRPDVAVFVSRLDGVAVGMVAVVGSGDSPELKRLFVDDSARGRGLAAELLASAEAHARETGAQVIRLETGTLSTAAVALYEKHGYTHIPRFGEYVDSESSVCMEKSL